MVSKRMAEKYCKEDISLIENYDIAVADTQNKWVIHHRDEVKILPSGIRVNRSREYLKEIGLLFDCPANELIFMLQKDHAKLHFTGHTYTNGRILSAEQRLKCSRPGEQNGMYGKHHSEESRNKISVNKRGKHIKSFTDEHKRKIAEANKHRIWTAEMRENMRQAQLKRFNKDK